MGRAFDCPPAGPDRRRRVASRCALLACLPLAGCTIEIERGPLADLLFKDYDLPVYRPDEAALGRELHQSADQPAAAALGGAMGAVTGNRLRRSGTTAAGALGGTAGAVVGRTMARIEHAEPLPEKYKALALALPIIATDPNKGPTLGVLPVMIAQEGARVTDILLCDLTYNAIDGVGSSFRSRRYFSDDAQLAADLSGSSEGAWDNELTYTQRRVGPKQLLFFRGNLSYKTDLSPRFFGIGNDTDEDDESSYTFRRSVALASLGIQLPLWFAAEFQERLASYKIGPGSLDDIDSTRAKFPGLPGMDERLNVLTHRIRLTFDTRDSRTAPTKGIFAEFNYDVADETLGSKVGFHRFSTSATVLIPFWKRRLVTVVRAGLTIIEGDDVPFYELASVGGKTTHRGYGEGRFVDQNAWVFGVEQRWNFFDYVMMDVRQVLQVAGFIDLGRVFSEDEGLDLKHAKVAVGGAIRLIVPESELVTSIDVGISDEGPAAFVGLDYPF